jgi:hypothetical protein
LHASADFDAKRQFLVDHVVRAIYNRYNVTIVGSVPVQSASGETKLQFRIEGKIDIAAIRSAASRKAALKAMRTMAPASAREVEPEDQPLSPLLTNHCEIPRGERYLENENRRGHALSTVGGAVAEAEC